jgi:hypothetical protein
MGSLVHARWTQSAEAVTYVQYALPGEPWRQSPSSRREAGEHEALLVGLPFDSEVRWRVVSEGARSEEVSAHTAAPPPDLPQGQLLVADPSRYDPAVPYLLLSLAPAQWSEPWWVLIVDRQLRPVWAVRTPPSRVSLHPRLAHDRRSLYLDHNSFWSIFDQGAQASVVQMSLEGTVLRTIPTPYAHHPFTDLPDGSVAYGAWADYADEQLELVHPDGQHETLWSCGAWLGELGQPGYCMSNTLSYDETREGFLFSFYSLETVVEIEDGQALRWFGHVPGGYAVEPALWWPHGAHWTEAGTLLVSSDLDEAGTETVAREYVADEASQTLRQIWSFGEGEGLYADQLGEAHRLPGGHTLHNYGQLAQIREVTQQGEIVWEGRWDSEMLGRSTPIDDLDALVP